MADRDKTGNERMAAATPVTLATGFAYPEGPRWHEGRLWIADQHAGKVHVLRADGATEMTISVPGGPSGMGWLPDGDLLIVSMNERCVYRWRSDSGMVVYADLSRFHPGQSNDMVVDRNGRAYIGNVGFDYFKGDPPRPTNLVAVEPNGAVRVVADDLFCPNGSIITPDGKTLIVAETFAFRLTAFTIAPDGSLCNRRIFADLGGRSPDGICLDAEGCVWAAIALDGSVIRVQEGGEIVDRVSVANANPYACVLGGPGRLDLHICCAPDHDPQMTTSLLGGRVDVIRVRVPGAGIP